MVLFSAAEGGRGGRGEGSVEHVEAVPVDSVGTSIVEDFGPYPPCGLRYTLVREEPL